MGTLPITKTEAAEKNWFLIWAIFDSFWNRKLKLTNLSPVVTKEQIKYATWLPIGSKRACQGKFVNRVEDAVLPPLLFLFSQCKSISLQWIYKLFIPKKKIISCKWPLWLRSSMEKIIALEELIEWSRIKIIHNHPWAWNKLYMKRLFSSKEKFHEWKFTKTAIKRTPKSDQSFGLYR